MAWEWLAPSAVVVGAGASYLGARLGARDSRIAASDATRQRAEQALREEWGRRFTAALDRTTSDDRLQRSIAFTILSELAKDEFATPADKALARRVLEAAIVEPVTELEPDVDGVDVVVDDGPIGAEGAGPP